MEGKFTVKQIKAYILSQDSLDDVMYNLSDENIRKANTPETIEECLEAIKNKFSFDTVVLRDGEITVEEDTYLEESDDVYDCARDHGEMVCDEFPMLEVSHTEAHKAYAITSFKLKEE